MRPRDGSELSQLVEKGLLKIKGKGRSTKYVPMVGDLNIGEPKKLKDISSKSKKVVRC